MFEDTKGVIRILDPRHFLLKFQARYLSGHVFVCYGYRFCLSMRFFDWILELLR